MCIVRDKWWTYENQRNYGPYIGWIYTFSGVHKIYNVLHVHHVWHEVTIIKDIQGEEVMFRTNIYTPNDIDMIFLS